MAIIGFNFTKIHAERLAAPMGKIEINNNATLKEVTEAQFNFGGKPTTGARFVFEYTSVYNPQVARIEMVGEVLFSDEPKKIAEIHKAWKKKDKMPKEILHEVLNTIMTRCNIEALLISKELNLPPPIQMPRLREAHETNEYIG